MKLTKILVTLLSLAICSQALLADGGRDKGAPLPFKLSADKLAGKGLGEFAPWPEEMILKGKSEHTFSELFSGEIAFGVYQAKPIKLNITAPWPFDEHCRYQHQNQKPKLD